MLTPALVLTTAMLVATPDAEPLAELSMGALRRPDLALHLVDEPASGEAPHLDEATRRRSALGGPVCSGDVCQPAVSVPGFDPSYDWHDRRSEMFLALLTRAHVEPVATAAWALFSTGLRLDWSPPLFDGGTSRAHGWGSIMLRIRLRIDAQGGIVVPPRPR